LNWQKVKRNYSDFRIGLPIIAPLLAISNFVLLAYNFTDLKDMMPIEIFGIIFATGFVSLMVLMGKVFRKKQQSTDFDLQFERARKHAMIYRIILEAQLRSFLSTDKQAIEIQETIDYLKSIESGTV